jgi:hypothetical protein
MITKEVQGFTKMVVDNLTEKRFLESFKPVRREFANDLLEWIAKTGLSITIEGYPFFERIVEVAAKTAPQNTYASQEKRKESAFFYDLLYVSITSEYARKRI